ncbi:MAG TPA: DUF2288 domain-containing protein [Stenomitos sp.]
MTTIREQLIRDLAEVPWSDIKPHSQRDAVIVVHEALDMLDVAEAIAQDNVAQVQVWIAEQLVQKPTAEQLSGWNADPTQTFSTLILQPYVLIRPVIAASDPVE